MAGHVTQLLPGESIDPRVWFDGPWEAIARHEIRTGSAFELRQQEAEVALYVLGGSGSLERSDQRIPLRSGSAITLLKDSHVVVHADELMDVLTVRLRT